MFRKSCQLSLCALMLLASQAKAQNVAINEDGSNPQASAMLDVSSTTKGLLAPRMTKAQRNAINTPANGLLIFQTDDTSGFYYYQMPGLTGASGWQRLATGLSTSTSAGTTVSGGWGLNGNSGTSAASFIGTTDYQPFTIKVNNAKVGYFGAPGNDAISLGANASAVYQGVAIGVNALTTQNTAMAFGYNAKSNVQQGIAIGANSEANTANDALALGSSAKAAGYQSIAVGFNAKTNTGTDGSVAIGRNATVNLNVQDAVAIGSGAIANKYNAIILGNASAQVGIGTTTPVDNAKLDVNGGYKLGSNGNVQKGVISTSYNSWLAIPAGGYLDVVITLPTSASGTKAAVAVSPGADLPLGVAIAWARLSAPNQVKVRLTNSATGAAGISTDLNVTVTEF